jgi:DNA-binding LacI/PurR family transcriptional regulator
MSRTLRCDEDVSGVDGAAAGAGPAVAIRAATTPPTGPAEKFVCSHRCCASYPAGVEGVWINWSCRGHRFAHGVKGMRRLLERDPALDGVFAGSDAVAAGAMEALREAGRTVPDDVGVVGFDDSSWAQRTRPHLSTVHQPAGDIGEHAADLVLRQLRGEDIPQRGLLLPSPVVWRASA